MRVFSATHTGLVRSSNQDALSYGTYGDGSVWAVVCDGMGGANGGEVAGTTAVEIIGERLERDCNTGMKAHSVRKLLQSAVLSANIEIYDKAQRTIELAGMGTTVVIAIVSDGCVYTAHAGDSRAYKLSGGKPIQLTVDHSMVQEMVQLGQITEEQARNHPRKNVITRALGVYSTVELDFTESAFDSGDMLLLCSDGLTNYVDDSELMRLAAETPVEQLADKYIETACQNGGGDNVTAVIICK